MRTALLIAVGVTFGCDRPCKSTFDCGQGTFCNAAVGACESECAADADCVAQGQLRCSALGRCVGEEIDEFSGLVDGWDDAPATGPTFAITQIALGDDGNALDSLGGLVNDQIRQGLLGGESLLLAEVAGVIRPYRGNDKAVTLKFYTARDADDPFFPANNFKVPPGHTTCCEFRIDPRSLSPDQQAQARAPAVIEDGVLRSLTPASLQFLLQFDEETAVIPIRHATVRADVTIGFEELHDGGIYGTIPARALAALQNPYCGTESPRCPRMDSNSSVLDLVRTSIGQPDVDVDGDGFESFGDRDGNAVIDVCFDGDGRVIEPVSSAPESCALHPSVEDGYSAGVQFSGVRSRVLGVAQ